MTGHAGQDNWGASAAPGAFPLVVLAPGYLQRGSAYAPLLRSWTQAGFVVAEVCFPLTDCPTASPDEADIINQPFDVSAVTSQLLAAAELSSFGGSYLPPGSPPTLFVQGTGDTVNLPADTRQLYEGDKEGAKALLWVDGSSHLSPYEGNGPAEQLVAKVTTDFLQTTLLDSGSAAGSMVRDGNVTGRSTLTTSGIPSAAR